jgi:hypothetical protein
MPMPVRALSSTQFLFPMGLLTFESPDIVSLGVALRFTRVPSDKASE